MVMKRYTPEEIQKVLGDHRKWLMDDGGSRANLSGANLSRANLYGANLSGANLSRANLYGADLSRANLYGANLSGADLSRANLSRANLSGADLSRANLSRANLSGANLSRADLSGAGLSGADLSGAGLSGVKIKKAAAFSGVYRYIAMPVIAEDGTEYVRLGCHFRSVADWEANFWNDPDEFPEDGSPASLQRLLAYRTCLEWLRIHRS